MTDLSDKTAGRFPAFQTRRKVRFADVDLASIVFYPRYFEFLNGAVEDWLESVEYGFGLMHLELGLTAPTRHIEAEFLAPSRLGDLLDIELQPIKVGRTSVNLQAAFACNGEERWRARLTLVLVRRSDGRPIPWPEEVKARMLRAGPVPANATEPLLD